MILSIESSCDDSSIAITEIASKKLIYHKKISQDAEHSPFGGVVPEVASRLHAIALPKILEETSEYFKDIKAIAITNEPGLSVTLLEGVMMAKALSISLNIPIIAINHLIGHIYSIFIEKEAILPISVLLVSGGHTMILEIDETQKVEIVATTLDDSYGESFDKVAKMLSLGYPGGPIVEKYAKNGNADSIDFPLPLKHKKELAFSFSGLKNAVRLEIEKYTTLDESTKSNIAASFQAIATQHLLQKTEKYFKTKRPKNFAIVGGASANLYLRESFENLCNRYDTKLHLSELKYCADNAAMIGRAAIVKYESSDFTHHENLKVNPVTTIF